MKINPERTRKALVELESALPSFPELAWRGMFDEYREIIGIDPEEPSTPISECPLAFHYANFLILAAAELGDKVRFCEGKSTFANLFVFCCGRTGTKKSTASDLIEEHITKNFPDTPHHVCLTSVSSGEGLIRTLMHRPNLFLRYDEVKDLFVTAGRNGNRLEPILNSAFDMRRVQGIIKNSRDSVSANEYYFNLLVNGTPDHVLLDLNEAFFKGGLLNRFLVFASKPTGVVKPVMGIPDIAKTMALAKKLYAQCRAWRQFAPLRGQIMMGLSPEARALHTEWYTVNTLDMQNRMDLEASPLTRLDVFVKKVAMVYAIMETVPQKDPQIHAVHMEAAIAVVEYCKACMEWMTDAWTGAKTTFNQSALMIERRVEGILRRKGCISERNLYRLLNVSMPECAKTVNGLVAMGQVSVSGTRPRMVHFDETCTCDNVPA